MVEFSSSATLLASPPRSESGYLLSVPGITERADAHPRPQIYPGARRWLLARCVSADGRDRAEAKQPWPPRYLPSGINQLNARLLESFALL